MSADVITVGPWSRKPEFGFLVAALSMVVLVMGWLLLLVPLGMFPVIVSDDGHGPYIAGIRPALAPHAAGIVLGDRVDLSTLTYSQRWRLPTGATSGYRLTLRVRHDDVWSDRVVVASPLAVPLRRSRWLASIVVLTIGVLLAMIVVVRRPSVATAAFAFYTWGGVPSFTFDALFSWIPDPGYGAVATVAETLVAFLPTFGLLVFVTRFPAEPSSAGGRVRMRLADVALLAGIVICLALAIFEPVRHHTWENAANLLNLSVALAGGVLAALQYRDASGEDRRRMGWVLIGYGVTMASIVVSNAAIMNPRLVSRSVEVAATISTIALPLALTYAILRHRVLDIGFALNRTVVYAAVTTVVVAAVSLVDWLAGKLIVETRIALAAEALVTVAIGVVLNAMHERIGRLVERVLFRARHTAERRLRNGIGALAFAETDATIERALTDEVVTALGLRSTALFRSDEETGHFRCVRATGWPDTQATIDGDALLVRTVRLRERPFHLADFGITEGVLAAGPATPMIAVPVADRHALLGFVLYGALADGTAPDPELIDLLGQLAAAAAAASAYVDARAARARLADIEKLLTSASISSTSA